MKKQIVIGLLISLSSISSTTLCSFLSFNILKKSFSTHRQKEAIRLINQTIQEILKKDPKNLYMRQAKQAVDNLNFEKAETYIKAYHCNQTYQYLENNAKNNDIIKNILQQQIKERLREKKRHD